MGKRQMRKQYLINKRFQINLAIRFFVCLLLVAMASGWAVYYSETKYWLNRAERRNFLPYRSSHPMIT
ncbi:MAG TPA: hypothetical protein ENG51_14090 [Deltaproteobacteria bacterium]|nr:hypothetical protein [Deltaproteobacteria bacterium]